MAGKWPHLLANMTTEEACCFLQCLSTVEYVLGTLKNYHKLLQWTACDGAGGVNNYGTGGGADVP